MIGVVDTMWNWFGWTINTFPYQKIKINGNKIKDLTSEIKEIKFGKLYESEIPFGYGNVENVKELN